MIRISLGNVGSGKTASEVREIFHNPLHRKYFSNIITNLKHCHVLKPEYIIKKIQIGTTKSGVPIYDYKLNLDFWKNQKEPLNIVLDEAHAIVDSRRSMSKPNQIITSWQSAIRRIIGATESGYGELVYVTQLLYSIDNRVRDLATQIRYHICHFQKTCKNCGASWRENTEMPETIKFCPTCRSINLVKHNHIIEVFKFVSVANYEAWKFNGVTTFYQRYLIYDIEKYFENYDTLQWENLFEEYR